MSNMFAYYLGRLLLTSAPEGRFPALNRCALRIMGATIGRKAVIYSSIKISRCLNLSVGVDSFVGTGSIFVGGSGSSVSIGSHCDISDNVRFVTGTHQIDPFGKHTAGKGYSKNIIVKDGVWIGYSALILPGVTIGEKALVAAGTVVYKDVPARTLVAGNPMRSIRVI